MILYVYIHIITYNFLWFSMLQRSCIPFKIRLHLRAKLRPPQDLEPKRSLGLPAPGVETSHKKYVDLKLMEI